MKPQQNSPQNDNLNSLALQDANPHPQTAPESPDPGTLPPDPGTLSPNPETLSPDRGTLSPDPGPLSPDPETLSPDPLPPSPNPPRYPFQQQDEQMRLSFEQKDFICKHIAAFKPHKQVADLFLQEFPSCGLTHDQVLTRIKYYSCDNRTRKWRFRIVAYRNQLNHNLLNRFRLANPYERLRHLEAMFHHALQPRIKRLFWYPARRPTDDKITYRTVRIKEPDLPSAARILSLIAKELRLDPDALLPLDDPYMLDRSHRDPQAFGEEFRAFQEQDPDASRDLDKTFGLI